MRHGIGDGIRRWLSFDLAPNTTSFRGRVCSGVLCSGACCKLRRYEPIEARVRSECVVVGPPCFDDPADLREAGEETPVETLVAQPAIEAFNEAVLGRLARHDVVPFHAPLFLPGQDGECRLPQMPSRAWQLQGRFPKSLSNPSRSFLGGHTPWKGSSFHRPLQPWHCEYGGS